MKKGEIFLFSVIFLLLFVLLINLILADDSLNDSTSYNVSDSLNYSSDGAVYNSFCIGNNNATDIYHANSTMIMEYYYDPTSPQIEGLSNIFWFTDTFKDSCINDTSLSKNYCLNSTSNINIVNCENGCLDGACISPESLNDNTLSNSSDESTPPQTSSSSGRTSAGGGGGSAGNTKIKSIATNTSKINVTLQNIFNIPSNYSLNNQTTISNSSNTNHKYQFSYKGIGNWFISLFLDIKRLFILKGPALSPSQTITPSSVTSCQATTSNPETATLDPVNGNPGSITVGFNIFDANEERAIKKGFNAVKGAVEAMKEKLKSGRCSPISCTQYNKFTAIVEAVPKITEPNTCHTVQSQDIPFMSDPINHQPNCEKKALDNLAYNMAHYSFIKTEGGYGTGLKALSEDICGKSCTAIVTTSVDEPSIIQNPDHTCNTQISLNAHITCGDQRAAMSLEYLFYPSVTNDYKCCWSLSFKTNLKPVVVGTPYQDSVLSDGSTPGPFKFSVSGRFPAGLTLNTDTGEITGTPTDRGQTFTVTATDKTQTGCPKTISQTYGGCHADSAPLSMDYPSRYTLPGYDLVATDNYPSEDNNCYWSGMGPDGSHVELQLLNGEWQLDINNNGAITYSDLGNSDTPNFA